MHPKVKADHLARASVRRSAPSTLADADQRTAQITKWLDHLAPDLVVNTAASIAKESTTERKVFWLDQAADRLAEAAAGVAPCVKGCSACCHRPVSISAVEANRIALASGRAMVQLSDAAMTQANGGATVHHAGTPCPMLFDSRCSVYEVRPFACRTHFSVDADAVLCTVVPGHDAAPLVYNAEALAPLYHMAHGTAAPTMADIRAFFPLKGRTRRSQSSGNNLAVDASGARQATQSPNRGAIFPPELAAIFKRIASEPHSAGAVVEPAEHIKPFHETENDDTHDTRQSPTKPST